MNLDKLTKPAMNKLRKERENLLEIKDKCCENPSDCEFLTMVFIYAHQANLRRNMDPKCYNFQHLPQCVVCYFESLISFVVLQSVLWSLWCIVSMEQITLFIKMKNE